jgi:DNA-binding XRE family transcriptional regulator
MATKFSDFMKEIEDEASKDADSLADLHRLRIHFRIGRKVAEARLKLNLSQKQVAERAKVDQADVSRIENGSANPTLHTLVAVAEAVGLSPDLVSQT